jgi:hypothetical protein
MDLQKLSGDDLYGYLGVPVRLELDINDAPICGNIYTIDPETHSVVLMQFDKSDSEKAKKLVWIPGSAIKLMHELGDDELAEECVPCSSKTIELIDNIIQECIEPKNDAEDNATIDARFKRLTDFLTSTHVPFTNDNQVIKIGPVKIERPYRIENFNSTNMVALQRTQKMLSDLISS